MSAELDILRIGERAIYLLEHVVPMIPREVWRAQGAEWMGQYEGDHWAEHTNAEVKKLRDEWDKLTKE